LFPDGIAGPVAQVAVVVVCLVGLSVVAGTAVSADEVDLSFDPDQSEVSEGEEMTVELVVSGADDGIAVYDIAVRLTDGEAATLTDVTLTGDPQLDLSQRLDDTTAAVVAVMGEGTHEPADEIAIAELTVRGEAAGESVELFVDGEVDIGLDEDNQYTVADRHNATIDIVDTGGDGDDGTDDGGDDTGDGTNGADDGDGGDGTNGADDGDGGDDGDDGFGPGFGPVVALAGMLGAGYLLGRPTA